MAYPHNKPDQDIEDNCNDDYGHDDYDALFEAYGIIFSDEQPTQNKKADDMASTDRHPD